MAQYGGDSKGKLTNGKKAAAVNRLGAEKATELKQQLHNPPDVICFDPNQDLGEVALYKGWSSHEKERKWLQVFAAIMQEAKFKREQGDNPSSVKVLCHEKRPKDPEWPGTPARLVRMWGGQM